jgi:hypothetical protein
MNSSAAAALLETERPALKALTHELAVFQSRYESVL